MPTPISREKPHPAQPDAREIELPWKTPKPGIEDPKAPGLIDAILKSPEYLQADQDVAFLQRDENRGIRLQLDYLKAERLFAEYGIRHSIVVFGSTRIPEPGAAQQKVAALESRLAGDRIAIITGGGLGLMEAANRGAHDVEAPTVGLNITLPHEQYTNPCPTPGLCFRFHYFAVCKLHFLLRARALVVFPGGYSTMYELFETLTLVQTRKIPPVPVILVDRSYWERAFDPEFLVAEGIIAPEDRELFWYAETAPEIWDDIQRWYRRAGRTLI